MSLKVEVISATNVPNVEKVGESDPYTTITYQGQSKKTEVKKSDLNPVWNETLEFDLKGVAVSPNDQLEVLVKDWERVGRNRLLGTAKIPLADLVRGGEKPVETNLSDANGRPLPQCKIKLKIIYIPPPGAIQAQTQAATTAAAAPGQVGQEVSQDVGGGEGEGEEEEEEEGEEEADTGPPVIDPATGQPIPKPKRKKKKRSTRRFRGKLSSKPQDFQIRVKILEARQLQGSNIQPVCKITCWNQTKQTRVKKSTNSPFWNETFFFNFYASPAELMDEMLEFTVLHSKKLRSDALIGSFKMDIGMVYVEPNHAQINKWLLLSDPEDIMAGAKGYLKICVMVLGPGDSPPSITPSVQDESEDIESNLLRPAGVQLRPATFQLKVYKCEDIPRMDSAFLQGVKKIFRIGEEQKELVDPYFVFSFAGKEVRTKIMYCSDHPEFNQTLRVGLQFPSMCERIKLIIRDWDRLTEDDTIATVWIHVPQISGLGENGFLPTFGPCFMNFYGATREYSDLPNEYEDLNLGKGEGVAYRGRALIELTSTLGEMPAIPVEDITSDDVLRVQKFMRRRKYRLHAAFMNATMVTAVDAPVEFEVSIGNYGNKLDENIAPCASTTQPTNAVFDGNYYYFLPWGGTKPCIAVDSHWEDISWRLETLNLLFSIIDSLDASIEQVKIGIKAKLPTPELAQLLISALDRLVQDCRKPLPEAQPGYHIATDLDRMLYQYRCGELEGIIEMAMHLSENATDINEALNEVENYLQILKNMSIEPQNSMPDVVIWMLSGEKRIAYHRIPANEVLYSKNPNYIGRQCGKVQSLLLKNPGEKADKEHWKVPALLRLKLWLGLQNDEDEWHRMHSEGELAVFAETYENQINVPVLGWTTKGPLSRPKWSDNQGKVKLKKECFIPPEGWRWDGDWYVSPELSMLYDTDAGHKTFMDDVYECQNRIPGTNWVASGRPWTDVKGDQMPSKAEIPLPECWKWEDEWQIDRNRAVDEEGWEYCIEATMGGYGPVERTYHLCRRRRWVRTRNLVDDQRAKKQKEKTMQAATEGWEYAPLFNMKFHAIERKMDMVRRRRWHRKMVATEPGKPCFFAMKDDKDEQEYAAALTAPRMFLTYQKAHKYQLRAYVYQARDLLAGDESGLSDPYATVSFLTQSRRTENIKQSLCPTWDQTLIFEEMEIHGDPRKIEAQPPDIYIEFYDHDTFGEPEFLGRTKAQPMVKLDPGDARTPVLQWYEIKRGNKTGGEILAAFELFLISGKDLPFFPPKKGSLYQVPNGIRPVMQRTGIEVLCWGVRNMKKFQLGSVTSPSIEFECAGHVLESTRIKNTKRNPNFQDPILFFDVMLPKEEIFMPPVNIRVRDHRQFGRRPTVGIHVLKSLEKFRSEPVYAEEHEDEDVQGPVIGNGPPREHVIDMPAAPGEQPKQEEDWEDIDWWSKYYASIGESDKCQKYLKKGLDKITVYDNELEKCEKFNDFNDFCETFEIVRGKDEEDEESNTVGEFKGVFKVYPLPQDPNEATPSKILSNLPSSDVEECVVRVYVIKAMDLQPNDPTGLADPYVEILLGKNNVTDRDNYIANSINPVFGRMFELTTVLPLHKDLTVRIKDYDLITRDDDIGETTIDLENRYLTKHRATCGLPKTYSVSGINQWRDNRKPKEILEEYCHKHHLTGPMFYGNNSVKVANRVYNLTDFEKPEPEIKTRSIVHINGGFLMEEIPLARKNKQGRNTPSHLGPADERLALHILNTFPLVKEHVETRPLYNPLQPGIEQGKLMMWVDIFPKSLGEPGPPFDIKPRCPKKYVLRVIIWNTEDVILEETSITGEKMSDIYLSGWMSGIDEKQKTDIHYRSLNGEGNFNWRFVFPFEYLPAENCMVVKKKKLNEYFLCIRENEPPRDNPTFDKLYKVQPIIEHISETFPDYYNLLREEKFWSLDETEQHLPPILMIQVWDNDKFSMDDFLGTVDLNLNNMALPAKRGSTCSLQQLPDVKQRNLAVKTVSLFEQKRFRGFWPVYDEVNGQRQLTGKVDMELELVTADEAEQRPAGKGQDEPNMNPKLEKPNRPETSFLWFTSPFKTLRYIIWRNYKWYFIIALLILLLLLLIFLFIYSFPGNFSSWIMGTK